MEASRLQPFFTVKISMLRWRTFLFAMLLILSLPIGLAGAVRPHCEAAPAVGTPTQVMRHTPAAVREDAAVMVRAQCRHVGATVAHCAHAVDQCRASTSCCTGLAAAAPTIVPPGFDAVGRNVLRPVSDAVPSFLTTGIDRPPSSFLS